MAKARHRGSCEDAQGLARIGPLVSVVLSAGKDIIDAGKEPKTATTKLMIDTGATSCVVDNEIPEALGLVPVRHVNSLGVGDHVELRPVYRMAMRIALKKGGESITATFEADFIAAPMKGHHEDMRGVIGRNFLKHFQFNYDGPSGTFEIVTDVADDKPRKKRRSSSQSAKSKRRQANKTARKSRKR